MYIKFGLSCVLLAGVVACGQTHTPVHADPEKGAGETVKEFTVQMERRFNVSPDGRYLVYMLTPGQALGSNTRDVITTELAQTVWVKDLGTGVTSPLPGQASGYFRPHPAWSPDGGRLAYVTRGDAGRYYVTVWDRATRKTRTYPDRSVELENSYADFAWAPDGRTLYFMAQRDDAIAMSEAFAPDEEEASFMKHGGRIQFSDPEGHGITILDSKPVADPHGMFAWAGATGAQEQASYKTDIVALDLESGAAEKIFTDAFLMHFSLSPDGSKLLAVSVRLPDRRPVLQVRTDFYVLDVKGSPLGQGNGEAATASNGVARDGQDRPIAPAVQGAKQPFVPMQSWSPDSTRIAWAEQGGASDGDVMVLEVGSGKVRNLTQGLDLPPDARDHGEERVARQSTIFHGRFGDDVLRPVWSRDGEDLYVRRMRPDKDDLYRMRGELWAIQAATGVARNLTPDADFSLSEVINLGGIAWSDAEDGDPLLAVRFGEDNASGFLRLDPAAGRTSLVARFRGTATRSAQSVSPPYVVAPRGKRLVYLSQRSDMPPELYALDVGSGRVTQVTEVNRNLMGKALPDVRLVTWSNAQGEKAGGLLWMPARDKLPPAGKPPVILEIYPGNAHELRSVGDESYRLTALNQNEPRRRLLEAGYAVLNPDVAVSGGGHACEQITDNTVKALEGVTATGLVDGDRAGVMGGSFGGYSVNCVVTHSQRFAAAVASAGLAHLFFDDLYRQTTGGHQARLGSFMSPESPEMIKRYVNDSPVYHAEQVATPLLLIHGKMDGQVPFMHSLLMYRAVQRAQKAPVRLVAYDKIGHSLSSPTLPHAMDEHLAWFDRYLKGDAEQRSGLK